MSESISHLWKDKEKKSGEKSYYAVIVLKVNNNKKIANLISQFLKYIELEYSLKGI